MRGRKRAPWRSILLLLGGMAPAMAQTPDGAVLALSCAACHGTGGASPGSIPSIRGKTAEYVATALTEFKSGKRPATVMDRLSKGYSEAEIKALAEHFASLR